MTEEEANAKASACLHEVSGVMVQKFLEAECWRCPEQLEAKQSRSPLSRKNRLKALKALKAIKRNGDAALNWLQADCTSMCMEALLGASAPWRVKLLHYI